MKAIDMMAGSLKTGFKALLATAKEYIVAGLCALPAHRAEKRPAVLVGAPFKGTWHVPGGDSFQALRSVDPGYDVDGILTARLTVPSAEIEGWRETADWMRRANSTPT